jgi:hypothetical protein
VRIGVADEVKKFWAAPAGRSIGHRARAEWPSATHPASRIIWMVGGTMSAGPGSVSQTIAPRALFGVAEGQENSGHRGARGVEPGQSCVEGKL